MLTKTLVKGDRIFYYKGRSYFIDECSYSNPETFTCLYRITIRPEYGFRLFNNQDIYSVVYESTSPRPIEDSRARACFKLATEFVNKELPRVDREIREELHNKEIEKSLSVLE